jgi:hypothetical protein
MMFDPSSTIIGLRNQQLAFDQVRLDGPVADRRAPRAPKVAPASTERRFRFRLLRARAA